MERVPVPTRTRPAVVVHALSAATFVGTAVVPLVLTSPPPGAATVALALAFLTFLALLVTVLWVAVRPGARGARWAAPALVLATVGMWFPLRAWAQEGQDPWAWLAGLTVAACALVGARSGVVAVVVLTAVAVIGGPDGTVGERLLTAGACALALWLMCQVMVWLLRLLAAADAERGAQAELAVAQERLRVSRELHDVLGHRLGVIAMKAELTADLVERDPTAAAAEAAEIRRLAARTLADSRGAVHGRTPLDLTAQLRAADLVLTSAGARVSLAADAEAVDRLPEHLSRLLAAVVREAVTNILRHSDARTVAMRLTGTPAGDVLEIVNDGARTPEDQRSGGGTGLAALAARCSASGGRLVAGPREDGRFAVLAQLPPAGAVA